MAMIYSVIVTLVLKMKGIVILMMNVKMILHVGQTIAHLLLDLTLNLIAVIAQLLEMKIFVPLIVLVA